MTAAGFAYVALDSERPGRASAGDGDRGDGDDQRLLPVQRQTAVTADSLHPPPDHQKRNIARGVMFLTTPTSTMSLVTNTLDHWRKQSSTHRRWNMNGIVMHKPVDGIAICSLCQQPGHYRSQCPSTGSIEQALCPRCYRPATSGHACLALSSVICNMCQKTGHVTGHCEQRLGTWAAIAGRAEQRTSPPPPVQHQQHIQHRAPAPAPAPVSAPLEDTFAARLAEQATQHKAQMETQAAHFMSLLEAHTARQQIAMAEQTAALGALAAAMNNLAAMRPRCRRVPRSAPAPAASAREFRCQHLTDFAPLVGRVAGGAVRRLQGRYITTASLSRRSGASIIAVCCITICAAPCSGHPAGRAALRARAVAVAVTVTVTVTVSVACALVAAISASACADRRQPDLVNGTATAEPQGADREDDGPPPRSRPA